VGYFLARSPALAAAMRLIELVNLFATKVQNTKANIRKLPVLEQIDKTAQNKM